MILSQLGDLAGAEEHLLLALDIHRLDRRRTQAIVLADLGHVQLRRGDWDSALAAWADFLDAAEGVRSVRITDAVTDVRARLGRMRGNSDAAALDQRAASITAE